jgi:3-hydroxyisobutyrate dehydrogenase-like beta-hydroxyacid dehydrogenase
MSERIGFVGLGLMGLAMARNLANAGFELTAFNRTSTKAE